MTHTPIQVNTHHTKQRGDRATALVNYDLISRGYFTFLPTSENCDYDLIADTGILWRIQVKMVSRGNAIPSVTSWSDRSGSHRRKIDQTRFDMFAIVNEDCDRIAYCPPEMAGKVIRWEHPTSKQAYYWWADFIDLKHNTITKTSTPGTIDINWPEDKDLINRVESTSYSSVARELGCTAASVRGRYLKLTT